VRVVVNLRSVGRFAAEGLGCAADARARTLRRLLIVAGLLLAPLAEAELLPLQPLIDQAEENAVISPPAGTYRGPVVIDKPLTLDGRGEVTIDAGGKGTVVLLDTDGATLKGLRLIGSGDSHNDIDAGVQVRGDFNVVKDNVIEDCLFGIDLQQSSSNRIRSKAVDLGVRGDSIRLWYSFKNRVEENYIRDSRDLVVWYSADNRITGNDARGGRYSLHFMYSKANLVEGNHFEDNAVGIFLMYSDGVVVRDNLIARAVGPTGLGIGFKETSDVTIERNRVLYNAVGLYIDVSPYQPETTNRLTGNLVAYNGVGVQWNADWTGNEFRDNRFVANLTQVAVAGASTAKRNLWEGNHWDDYEGFDRDGDGVGDTPYELYGYADRLWRDVPHAQFFKGTPMLEVLDFLERLAPFSEPKLMLSDAKPLMDADADFRLAKTAAPDAEPASAPSSLDKLRSALH